MSVTKIEKFIILTFFRKSDFHVSSKVRVSSDQETPVCVSTPASRSIHIYALKYIHTVRDGRSLC